MAAETDYRLILEEEGLGRRHNAVLVRENVTVTGHGLREISPKSEVHPATLGTGDASPGDCGCEVPPKYVNWVRVRAAGYDWVVGVVHLTPSASQYDANRILHNKQVRNATEWFSTRDAEPIIMGDFNAKPDSNLMDDLRVEAKPFSAETHRVGVIDHVWARRHADVRGSEVRALEGYGSDHKPLRTRVTVTL